MAYNHRAVVQIVAKRTVAAAWQSKKRTVYDTQRYHKGLVRRKLQDSHKIGTPAKQATPKAKTGLVAATNGQTVIDLDKEYDPYAVLLQLQHDVEQQGYHQQNMAKIIQQQSRMLAELSQNFVIMVKHIEQLEQQIEDLNEK